MARIKHTKTELKIQTDSLRRFRHFLPMLQLKKQQLQSEIAHVDARIQTVEKREKELRSVLDSWVGLMADPDVELAELVALDSVETETGNIAGVSIPVFKEITVKYAELDLFETPAWLDDAQAALDSLMACRAEISILEEERRRVGYELRVTAQRVNLFEKVKIPECRENIRVIRIFLGDEQTAAVARGKISKRRSEQRQAQEETAA